MYMGQCLSDCISICGNESEDELAVIKPLIYSDTETDDEDYHRQISEDNS